MSSGAWVGGQSLTIPTSVQQLGDFHPGGDLVRCRVLGQLGCAHAQLLSDGAGIVIEDGVKVVIDDAPAPAGGDDRCSLARTIDLGDVELGGVVDR